MIVKLLLVDFRLIDSFIKFDYQAYNLLIEKSSNYLGFNKMTELKDLLIQ